jgi:hypothetical protein
VTFTDHFYDGKRKYIGLALISSAGILIAFALVNIYSFWFGSADSLLPVKVSFGLSYLLVLFLLLDDIIASLRDLKKNLLRPILAIILIVSPTGAVIYFNSAFPDFILARPLLQNLTFISLEVKTTATIGVLLPLVPLGYVMKQFFTEYSDHLRESWIMFKVEFDRRFKRKK